MANFQTHISFGIALGAVDALALVGLALVPMNWSFLVLAALAVTVGSVLPDVDSDTGVPFHVAFGSLSLLAGVIAFLFA